MKDTYCSKHVPCDDCRRLCEDRIKGVIIKKLETMIFNTNPEVLEVKIGDSLYQSTDKEKNELLIAFRNSAIIEATRAVAHTN